MNKYLVIKPGYKYEIIRKRRCIDVSELEDLIETDNLKVEDSQYIRPLFFFHGDSDAPVNELASTIYDREGKKFLHGTVVISGVDEVGDNILGIEQFALEMIEFSFTIETYIHERYADDED